MTDEELIEALRSIDHMNVDDCFLQSYFYSKAADRIEELVKEVDRRIEPEQVEGLIKLAEPIMAELYGVECSYREAAEAKLAKAVAALTALANMRTAGDSKGAVAMAWHAREVLTELDSDLK